MAQVAQYLGHTDVAITEDDIQHVSTLEFLNLTSILSESHVSESIYVKFEELYLVSTHLLLSVQVGAAPELGLSGFIRELPVWGEPRHWYRVFSFLGTVSIQGDNII